MVVIFLPLLVCIIGLFIYLVAAPPKVVECGRMMFWVGLLAFLLTSPAGLAAIR
jgi:hypothetical protein